MIMARPHCRDSIAAVVTSDGTPCRADNLDLRGCDGGVGRGVYDAPANDPRVLRATGRDDACKQRRRRRAGIKQPSYMLVHTASMSVPRVRKRDATGCRIALSTTTRMRCRAKSLGCAGDGVD